jgi:hypothetical protein
MYTQDLEFNMNPRTEITLNLTLDYRSISEHLELLPAGLRDSCQQIWRTYEKRFRNAPGSSHNHQAWPGGYADHIAEVLNYARHLYALDCALGRPMPFSLADAILVLFFHDIEKPFRLKWKHDGAIDNDPAMASKSASREMRENLLLRNGITLSAAQANALRYVEGEGADYSRDRRVMNELAAFCHKADVWSARQCYDHPRAEGDEWIGALRHNP